MVSDVTGFDIRNIPMSEETNVITQLESAVLTLTLNRPNKLNSMTKQLAQELIAGLTSAATNPEVRCVVIRGAGKAFCAGQDLGSIDTPDLSVIVKECCNPIVKAITELDKPVLAAVHGVAAGAGANLALACDFVVASTEASFIQSFIHVGLVPDTGGTFILPRLVGLARAKSLMMLGERVSGADAHDMGMIYKAVEPAGFEQTVSSLAAKLAALPTKALGETKRLLQLSLTSSISEQLTFEAAGQRHCGTTHDYAEGVKAFLEKRPANFEGR